MSAGKLSDSETQQRQDGVKPVLGRWRYRRRHGLIREDVPAQSRFGGQPSQLCGRRRRRRTFRRRRQQWQQQRAASEPRRAADGLLADAPGADRGRRRRGAAAATVTAPAATATTAAGHRAEPDGAAPIVAVRRQVRADGHLFDGARQQRQRVRRGRQQRLGGRLHWSPSGHRYVRTGRHVLPEPPLVPGQQVLRGGRRHVQLQHGRGHGSRLVSRQVSHFVYLGVSNT